VFGGANREIFAPSDNNHTFKIIKIMNFSALLILADKAKKVKYCTYFALFTSQ
jgi:hypothetical protein